jgi:hypothetical protein
MFIRGGRHRQQRNNHAQVPKAYYRISAPPLPAFSFSWAGFSHVGLEALGQVFGALGFAGLVRNIGVFVGISIVVVQHLAKRLAVS